MFRGHTVEQWVKLLPHTKKGAEVFPFSVFYLPLFTVHRKFANSFVAVVFVGLY